MGMPPAWGYPGSYVNAMAPGPAGPRPAPVLVGSFYTPGGHPAQLYHLANGHRVLIEQRPTDVVSLRTFVNTGSIHEDPIHGSPHYGMTGFPSGIAHLDEHCHFLTTKNFPKKNSWVATVQQMGAQLNATTSPEWIQHELTFSREDLPAMIAMHGEAVMRPLYRQEDITQEKNNVLNEASERTSAPMAKVMNKSWELMFDRPLFQTLGKRSDIMRTTAEQLQAFYDAYYTPGNMITVVSGNLDPTAALMAVDQQFGQNAPRVRGDERAAVRLALRPGEIRSATVTDPKLSFSMTHLAFPAPEKTNPKERMAMEFLATMLGKGDLSLLNSALKDRMRLVSSIGCDYSPMKATGMMEIGFHTTPGREREALTATLGLIQTLSNQPISHEKMTELRNRAIYAFRRELNDVELSTQFMGGEALSESLPYYMNYIQIANSITPDDLLMVARKYLNTNRYAVVFGVPGSTASPSGIEDVPRGGAR